MTNAAHPDTDAQIVYTTVGGLDVDAISRGDRLTVTYASVHTENNGDQTIEATLLLVRETDHGHRLVLSGDAKDDEWGLEVLDGRATLHKRLLMATGNVGGRTHYKTHRVSTHYGVRLVAATEGALDRSEGQFYVGDRVTATDDDGAFEGEVVSVSPHEQTVAVDLDEPVPVGFTEKSSGKTKRLCARQNPILHVVDDDGNHHWTKASEAGLRLAVTTTTNDSDDDDTDADADDMTEAEREAAEWDAYVARENAKADAAGEERDPFLTAHRDDDSTPSDDDSPEAVTDGGADTPAEGETITVAFESYPGESPKETLTGEVTRVTGWVIEVAPTEGSAGFDYMVNDSDRVRVYDNSNTVYVYHPDRGTDDLTHLGQRAEITVDAEDDAPTPAAAVVRTLAEGDVISVPQYANDLVVSYVGELNGEANAFIGVEFANGRAGAEKSLVTNRTSGRIYLIAGTVDKGEVQEMEIVERAAAGDADEVAESDGFEWVSADDLADPE